MLPVQLTVKALDDDKRIITGIASTPTPDRMGDIVEPMGAKFRLPLPLLWQHNHQAPVGRVIEARATAAGVTFKAEIARVEEHGPLRDRVETAWGEIKAGLVGAVSIGFNALSSEALRNGGRRFKEWEFLELSLTAIPANHEAVIQQFHGKSVTPGADSTLAGAEGIIDRLARINRELHDEAADVVGERLAADRRPLKMTWGLLAGVISGQHIVREALLGEVGRLEKRIAELEAQQSQQKALPYRGVWKSSETYRAGSFVTFRGSAWHANQDTDRSPADDPTAWTLAIKKGRDAKGVHHHDE